MTTNQILEKVKAFPPLDDTASKVQRICNDENSSLGELVKAVEVDPMIVTNILKAANSPIYGFSREINNISQAISLFGMETVKGFVFSSFLQKKIPMDLSPYKLDTKKFISITEQQNAFTFQWLKSQRAMLNVLATASFLMEIGKIILSNIIVENNKISEYQSYIGKVTSFKQLNELEQKVFGTTTEKITAVIFENWNFEQHICDAIKYSNDPDDTDDTIQPYAQVLHVVKTLIPIVDIDIETRIKNSIELVKKYDLDEKRFIHAIEEFFQIELAVA